MDVYEAMRTRTSVRGYRRIRSRKTRGNGFDAARIAPSGKNGQPWTYIVRDVEIRAKLVAACKGQGFVAEISVVIAACGRGGVMYQKMGGYWNSLPSISEYHSTTSCSRRRRRGSERAGSARSSKKRSGRFSKFPRK
ncbi:MAG: hypothetical protein MZU95_00635 [Desulfomicrobium escambiense]|nr:hypothetical protein [Desulfomicrobium escambiense]